MIKDIIYDFDGTISDTYPIFTEAFIELLRRHGVEDTYENVYKHLKVSVGHAISQYSCFPERPNPEFHEIHNVMALERQKPLEGALDILKYACENGGRNYIYTHSSKNIVYPLLEKWGMLPYITDMIDGTYVIPRKPAPDGVNILVEKNAIDRREAIIVGDRDIDVLSGRNGGIFGCLIDPEHYYDSFKDYDYRIDRLEELKNIICK